MRDHRKLWWLLGVTLHRRSGRLHCRRDAHAAAPARRGCLATPRAGDEPSHIIQPLRADDLDARDEASLFHVANRNRDALMSDVPERGDHRQDAGDRHHAPVKRQLAEQGPGSTGSPQLF